MVMGQATSSTEVLVIGAGPGGYVAAIRAAQLGYDVMLVDKAGELGGMCLHHGCIPSKALIHAMNLFWEMRHAEEMGIITDQSHLDFSKTMDWKQSVVDKLAAGIRHLCEKHNIQVVQATAKFQTPTRCIIEGDDVDFNAVEFRHAIIGTGSLPRSLPFAQFGGRILSSKEVLELQEVPKRFAVIGGGYIGIELGAMLKKAGSEVTVLEAGSTILGAVEPELAKVAKEHLEKIGLQVRTDTKVDQVEQDDNEVRVQIGDETLTVDKCLVAVGHAPVTDGLQLDLAGVEVDEKGFIKINEQCQTSAEHIYAIGDVTGGMMLAHKASAQGRIAAEVIAGHRVAFEPQVIPAVIFSDPEIATVGLREQEARERYGDSIKVGTFPFSALGKAIAIHEPDGFVKMISDENGVLLGVHMVGPSVTDYISEAALALEMAATAQDVSLTIHPHPTLAESLSEAAEALMGEAIHLYQPK